MIPPRELVTHLKKAPFVPFRIVLNSGPTLDVRHPEMVRVGRSTFTIYQPDPQDSELYDSYSTVSLLLVERIEHRESTQVS